MTAPLRERLEAAIAHIHTYQGNPIQIAKHIATLTEALAALAEREGERRDAERYRWLIEDHADWQTRKQRDAIANRLGVMGHGAIDAAIDAARAASGKGGRDA